MFLARLVRAPKVAMQTHSKMVIMPKATAPPPPGGWSKMGKQPAPIDALKESMDKVADVVLSSLGDEIAKKAKAESDVSKKAAKKAKQKAKKAETE